MSVQTPETNAMHEPLFALCAEKLERFACAQAIKGLDVDHDDVSASDDFQEGVHAMELATAFRAADVAADTRRQIMDAEVVDTRVAELEKRLYDSMKLNLEQQALIDRTVEYLQRAQADQFRHVGSALVAVNALERLSKDCVVDTPVIDERVAELEAQLADEKRRNSEHLERINALTDTAGQAANHIASLKFELAERTAHLKKSEKCATKMAFRAETAQRRADDLRQKLDQAVRYNAEHLEVITTLRGSRDAGELKLGEAFGLIGRLRSYLDNALHNGFTSHAIVERCIDILDGKP